eukprot:9090013-Lingulodinium_polyedra.AAC.1
MEFREGCSCAPRPLAPDLLVAPVLQVACDWVARKLSPDSLGAGLRLRVAASGATQDAAVAAEPASEGGPRTPPARTS